MSCLLPLWFVVLMPKTYSCESREWSSLKSWCRNASNLDDHCFQGLLVAKWITLEREELDRFGSYEFLKGPVHSYQSDGQEINL